MPRSRDSERGDAPRDALSFSDAEWMWITRRRRYVLDARGVSHALRSRACKVDIIRFCTTKIESDTSDSKCRRRRDRRVVRPRPSSQSSSFTPTAMFDTTRPSTVNVGGFSTTTMFSIVSAVVAGPPRAALASSARPPSARPAPVSHRVTVPHAAHRTAADPAGYASVHRHPSHRTRDVSALVLDRGLTGPSSSSAPPPAAAVPRAVIVPHRPHRTAIAPRACRIVVPHPSHRLSSLSPSTFASVRVT